MTNEDSGVKGREGPEVKRDGFTYFPETGRFVGKRGRTVGHTSPNGYIMVGAYGRPQYAHRLAVYIMAGEWPPEDVDHINGDRADNRWENLRLVSRSQNLMNKRSTRELPKNVYKTVAGTYLVALKYEGTTRYFGTHSDLEFACFLAEEVRAKYHGQYAPYYV